MIKSIYQIFFSVLFLIFLMGCSPSQNKTYETKMIEIIDSSDVDDLVYQLGELHSGEQKKLELVILNRTQKPVVINEVRQFCGCTIPNYNREPIVPDSTGKIEVLFVADHSGIFSKSLKVFVDNKKKPFQMLFKGSVISQDN